MAGFGAKYPCWAPMTAETDSALPTYGTGKVLGKLVNANLSITNAEGEIWGDDERAEYLSEFASGTLDVGVTSLTDDDLAAIYGATVADGEVTFSKDDTIPYGCVAYYKVLMRGGVKFYKGYWYPKCKAVLTEDTAETKGSSINFTAENIQFAVDNPLYGGWRVVETFTTEAAAKTWVKSKVGITP